MGPSKKRREDAWDVRRQQRAQAAKELEEVKRKAEEARRRAEQKKGGKK
ncbi:hypothetical protein [Actinomadura sediminis]|uniref:Uncharacterized protein n=1 Tax=Actinomadura sediminis TaxID=1038904 RepID=A0ABW3ES01_9ACTN